MVSTIAQSAIEEVAKQLYPDEDEAKEFITQGNFALNIIETIGRNVSENNGSVDLQGLKASLITISKEQMQKEVGIESKDIQTEMNSRVEKQFDQIAEDFVNNFKRA